MPLLRRGNLCGAAAGVAICAWLLDVLLMFYHGTSQDPALHQMAPGLNQVRVPANSPQRLHPTSARVLSHGETKSAPSRTSGSLGETAQSSWSQARQALTTVMMMMTCVSILAQALCFACP